MKEQLQKRLDELKAEFQSGQKALAELEGKEKELKNTLSRISGAIQVLEEELKEAGDPIKPVKVTRPRTRTKRRP